MPSVFYQNNTQLENAYASGRWRSIVAVPVLNEDKHLDSCIRALLAQQFDAPITILISTAEARMERVRSRGLVAAHPAVHYLEIPGASVGGDQHRRRFRASRAKS